LKENTGEVFLNIIKMIEFVKKRNLSLCYLCFCMERCFDND